MQRVKGRLGSIAILSNFLSKAAEVAMQSAVKATAASSREQMSGALIHPIGLQALHFRPASDGLL